jgi:hypothetical protein
MAHKWTPEQKAKFMKTMAAKRAQQKKGKGTMIPLDAIPALPVVKKTLGPKALKRPDAEAVAAMGELIVSVWEALQRRNAR